MESQSLKTFKRKMTNPLHWRKANRIFVRYTKADLSQLDGAKRLIQELSNELGVPLSSGELKQAASWLMEQGINPQSKRERMMIWKKVM